MKNSDVKMPNHRVIFTEPVNVKFQQYFNQELDEYKSDIVMHIFFSRMRDFREIENI